MSITIDVAFFHKGTISIGKAKRGWAQVVVVGGGGGGGDGALDGRVQCAP